MTGYRYHPAVIAEAAATLRTTYPARCWLSVGSGAPIDEHVPASVGRARTVGTPGSARARR